MTRQITIIISILMVIMAGAVTGSFWLTTKRRPELIVSDINLGIYKSAHTLERVLRLENRGPGELLIHDATICCGMSLVGDFPKTIAAGSTDVIVLSFKTPDSPVPLEKYFTLRTNDPEEPVKKVFVRGMPDLPVYASPPVIDLKHIDAGDRVVRAAMIMIPDDSNQASFNIVTSSQNIRVSELRSGPFRRIENREYETFVMDVGVDKETPRGPLQEYIYIKTGISRRPYVVIPVKGMVERGLRTQPNQIFFGMVAGDSIVNRIIRLEVIGPGWGSIKIRPSGIPGIAAKLQQKGKEKFELHVSLDPARMPKQLKSYITLEDSSGDTLQIPLLAMQKTL